MRQTPVIRRLNQWHCCVVAPGAWMYEQGGVTRHIDADFPCPLIGEAKARWGSGTRTIVVSYADGSTASLSEIWP